MLHDNDGIVLFQRMCISCHSVYGCSNTLVVKDCAECLELECSFSSRIVLEDEVTSGFCKTCVNEISGRNKIKRLLNRW
jgi:hypothetical protein